MVLPLTPRCSAPLALALFVLASSASAQVRISAPSRVDTSRVGAPCNETSISLSPANPLEVVAAWNDYRGGTARLGVGLSDDGGATWSDLLLRPPLANQTSVEGDPMTAFDAATGRLWAGGIAFGANGGVFVARKDAGQPSFGASVMAAVTAAADKGWMAAGPDPLQAGATKLYVGYNQGLLVSADLGATFGAPLPLGFGTAFQPRVGPGGELYVAYWSGGTLIRVFRSLDGGQTVQGPFTVAVRMDVWGNDGSRVPGDYRAAPYQSLAVDPTSGDLHCLFADTTSIVGSEYDLDLYHTTSTDQGTTWSTPAVLNGGEPVGDQFFPWLECDADGRLHAVWYDSRETPQSDLAAQGLLDAYYGWSDDGGATWSEARLTSASWSTANDGFGGQFIGDYLGLTTGAGRVLPVYMETSTNGDADIFTHRIRHGPAVGFCYGIGCPCANDDPTSGCGNDGFDGQPDTGAVLAASGSADLGADDLVFELSGLTPGQFALVYTGQTPTSTPFGNGARCIDVPFFRYPIMAANGAGVATLGPGQVVSFATGNFGAGGVPGVGATWHYQAWYRDPAGPCGATFNFSNALTVIWE